MQRRTTTHRTTRTGSRGPLAGALLLAGGLTAAAVQVTAEPAARPDWQPPQPSIERGADGVDARTLDQFVLVFRDLMDVREEYSERIRQADDTNTAQQLQQEAQQQMVQLVQESPLSVDKYNEISTRMNEDPAFARSILSRVESDSR